MYSLFLQFFFVCFLNKIEIKAKADYHSVALVGMTKLIMGFIQNGFMFLLSIGILNRFGRFRCGRMSSRHSFIVIISSQCNLINENDNGPAQFRYRFWEHHNHPLRPTSFPSSYQFPSKAILIIQ